MGCFICIEFKTLLIKKSMICIHMYDLEAKRASKVFLKKIQFKKFKTMANHIYFFLQILIGII